jgi:hypothetical protein
MGDISDISGFPASSSVMKMRNDIDALVYIHYTIDVLKKEIHELSTTKTVATYASSLALFVRLSPAQMLDTMMQHLSPGTSGSLVLLHRICYGTSKLFLAFIGV